MASKLPTGSLQHRCSHNEAHASGVSVQSSTIDPRGSLRNATDTLAHQVLDEERQYRQSAAVSLPGSAQQLATLKQQVQKLHTVGQAWKRAASELRSLQPFLTQESAEDSYAAAVCRGTTVGYWLDVQFSQDEEDFSSALDALETLRRVRSRQLRAELIGLGHPKPVAKRAAQRIAGEELQILQDALSKADQEVFESFQAMEHYLEAISEAQISRPPLHLQALGSNDMLVDAGGHVAISMQLGDQQHCAIYDPNGTWITTIPQTRGLIAFTVATDCKDIAVVRALPRRSSNAGSFHLERWRIGEDHQATRNGTDAFLLSTRTQANPHCSLWFLSGGQDILCLMEGDGKNSSLSRWHWDDPQAEPQLQWQHDSLNWVLTAHLDREEGRVVLITHRRQRIEYNATTGQKIGEEKLAYFDANPFFYCRGRHILFPMWGKIPQASSEKDTGALTFEPSLESNPIVTLKQSFGMDGARDWAISPNPGLPFAIHFRHYPAAHQASLATLFNLETGARSADWRIKWGGEEDKRHVYRDWSFAHVTPDGRHVLALCKTPSPSCDGQSTTKLHKIPIPHEQILSIFSQGDLLQQELHEVECTQATLRSQQPHRTLEKPLPLCMIEVVAQRITQLLEHTASKTTK